MVKKYQPLLFLFIFVVGGWFMVGCSDDDDSDLVTSGTPNADVTGTWAGPMSTSLIVSSPTLTMMLSQTVLSVSGTYSQNFGTGTVSGSVIESTMAFTLDQLTPGCTGSFSGTGVVSGSTMSLTLTGTDTCFGSHSNGVASLTKM